MVSTAVWILTLAVAAGSGLGLWNLRATEGGSRPPLAVGLGHGVIGAVGLAILLYALQGPPRGIATGVSSFGPLSALLFAGALLTGIATLLLRRKGIVMAIHAGIAITGYVLLLAWSALG